MKNEKTKILGQQTVTIDETNKRQQRWRCAIKSIGATKANSSD